MLLQASADDEKNCMHIDISCVTKLIQPSAGDYGATDVELTFWMQFDTL